MPISTINTNSIANAAVTSEKAVTLMQPLGVGQTWQTVTRAALTTYTNTTGKPIMVLVLASSGAGNFGSMNVSINGGTQFGFAQSQNSSGTVACNGNFIVPAGATYTMYMNNLGINLTQELR